MSVTQPKSAVGVLFIHGMGAQKQGDTLADFGEPLALWARRWFEYRDEKVSPNAGLLDCPCGGEDGQPFHVHCEWPLPDSDSTISVILSESWWADEFKTASSTSIISWLPSMILRAFGLGILLSIVTGAAVTFGSAALINETLEAAFFLSVLTAVTILVAALALPPITLLLGMFRPTQKLVKPFVNFLTAAVGDVMIYQKHPFTALQARQRVVRDLAWLSEKSSKTVVAAHSLGSLLAVDALSSPKKPECDYLLTFGSAIKLLRNDRAAIVRQLFEREKLAWSNLYDPMDLISGSIGPYAETPNFPLDMRVDNGRSVFLSHTTYPKNTEQFIVPFISCVRSLFDGKASSLREVLVAQSDTVAPEEKSALENLKWRWWARRLLTFSGVVATMTTALAAIHYNLPPKVFGDISKMPFLPEQLRQIIAVEGDPGGLLSLAHIIVATVIGAVLILLHRAVANFLLAGARGASLENLATRKSSSTRLQASKVLIILWGALLPLAAVWGLVIYVDGLDSPSRLFSAAVFVALPVLAVLTFICMANLLQTWDQRRARISAAINGRKQKAAI